MKKLICVMLSVMMTVSQMDEVSVVHAETEQKCGKNAEWSFSGHTLTISGTGRSYNITPLNKGYENCPWENYRDDIQKIVVEEGITQIGKYLFSGLPNLETVELPDSLSGILPYCFYDCRNLSQINIPDHTVVNQHVFDGSSKVFSYSDADCQIINESLFYSYSGSANSFTVPDGVQVMASGCFADHTEIEEITLPDGLQIIQGNAFNGCINLNQMTLPDTLTYIGNDTFFNCASLESIGVPASVQTLDSGAFQKCTGLCSVTFSGNRISEIPSLCFSNCAALTEISLPDSVEKINSSAFANCIQLSQIQVSSGLNNIGTDAFSSCTALKKIQLPETLQTIGVKAFANCTALSKINIPDYVECIGADAFLNCPAVHDSDNMATVDGRALIHYAGEDAELTIPDGIIIIADGAFKKSAADKTNLVSVICPDSLRYIGAEAFSGCTAITSMALSDGLLSISKNAFYQCSSLKSLTIPASVMQIEAQEKCAIADIYGTSGTTAEQFASENGITFHAVSDTPHGADMTFDYTKDGWYFGNSREIFGDDYFLTDADRAKLEALGIDTRAVDKAWGGSCLGLAVTAILVKNGVFSPEMLQSDAKTLSEVQPTDAIRSFINYYHAIAAEDGVSRSHEPINQKIYRMIQIAKNVKNGESPFLLTYTTPTASHAVVGYGQEDGAWEFDGKAYDARILVWDSNFPKALSDEACFYYDSKTFDYCIPYYGVHYADDADDNAGDIQLICNDLSILNAYPYSAAEKQPDCNGDGTVDVADAVLLARFAAEDDTLTKAQTDAILNANADADDDHLITILDVIAILKSV